METKKAAQLYSTPLSQLVFNDRIRLAIGGAYLYNLYQVDPLLWRFGNLKDMELSINNRDFLYEPIYYIGEAFRDKSVETYRIDKATQEVSGVIPVYFIEDDDIHYAADHEWEREWHYETFFDKFFIRFNAPSETTPNVFHTKAVAQLNRAPHSCEKMVDKSFMKDGLERTLKPIASMMNEELKIKISPPTTSINNLGAFSLLFGAFVDFNVMDWDVYQQPDHFSEYVFAEIGGRTCRFSRATFNDWINGIDGFLEDETKIHLFLMKGGRQIFVAELPSDDDQTVCFMPITTVEEFCKIHEASKGEITLALCPLLAQDGATHAAGLADGRVEFSNIDGKVSLEVFLHTPKVAPEQEDQVLEEAETQA